MLVKKPRIFRAHILAQLTMKFHSRQSLLHQKCLILIFEPGPEPLLLRATSLFKFWFSSLRLRPLSWSKIRFIPSDFESYQINKLIFAQ